MNKTILTKKTNFDNPGNLDSNNPLKEFSNLFYHPIRKNGKPFIYFSGNSLGLQPKNAEKYVNEELESWKKLGVEGHLKSIRPWLPYHEFLTSYSAELVGALDTEVVVMNSLTVNLHLLMASFYRPNGKRKKILIEDKAFPSDKYAIQSQLRFHGNDPIQDLLIIQSSKNNIISLSSIIDILDQHGQEIALVLIGGVNYYTGQVFDMKSITNKAQNCGCRVGFDLAHATGNLPMHLHDWGVDFAAWCGYKYLNGGPGAPSTIFIHERHLNRKDIPRFEGWWGHDKESRFDMPNIFKPLKTAEAWQLSNPPILSMAPLIASLEIFHDIGIDQIRKQSIILTKYLENLLKSELSNKISIITPDSIENRGCQLSIQLNYSVNNVMDILHNNGIICDWRNPDIIRVAPVPVYNSFTDCYNFVKILKKILND